MSKWEKYGLDSDQVGWILADGRNTLKDHGSVYREVSPSMLQNSVKVSGLDEDTKGWCIRFVRNRLWKNNYIPG